MWNCTISIYFRTNPPCKSRVRCNCGSSILKLTTTHRIRLIPESNSTTFVSSLNARHKTDEVSEESISFHLSPLFSVYKCNTSAGGSQHGRSNKFFGKPLFSGHETERMWASIRLEFERCVRNTADRSVIRR